MFPESIFFSVNEGGKPAFIQRGWSFFSYKRITDTRVLMNLDVASKWVTAAVVGFAALDHGYLAWKGESAISRYIVNQSLRKMIFTMMAIGGVLFLLRRDTWLWFLSETALPPTVLAPQSHPANGPRISIDVDSRARRVVWWAAGSENTAGPSSDKNTAVSARDAYGTYSNAGVAPVTNGRADIQLYDCPTTYQVSTGRILPQHVHWRASYDNGLLGPVQTASISC